MHSLPETEPIGRERRPHDPWGPAPAKALFRALLRERAAQQGLSPDAIDTLVQHAQLTYWRAQQPIFVPSDVQDLTHFVVAGAVKVMCRGWENVPVVVQIVKPGRWFGAAWFFDGPERREFAAVAHVPSVVAMISQEVMRTALARLTPDGVVRLMTYSWRVLSRLLLERCLLLTMPLQDRVAYALVLLARDFGRPHAGGTLIDLPLANADLGRLAVATRANVARSMAAFRHAQLLQRVGQRVVLQDAFIERFAGGTCLTRA